MTNNLMDYILDHTQRGECSCGRCSDRGNSPDPTGHVADVEFFEVAARNAPDRATFEQLARAHRGEFGEVDVFDGKEHSYIELGGWLGDQSLALQFMGLGALLGTFELLTPSRILPDLPVELRQQMAASGRVTIRAKEQTP